MIVVSTKKLLHGLPPSPMRVTHLHLQLRMVDSLGESDRSQCAATGISRMTGGLQELHPEPQGRIPLTSCVGDGPYDLHVHTRTRQVAELKSDEVRGAKGCGASVPGSL